MTGQQIVDTLAYVAAALIFLDALRSALDILARRLRWRVRGFGRLLCFFRRTGGTCLRCRTDFRYVAPHDTPYRREGGLCVFPLCEECWQELEPETRLPFYLAVILQWAQEGRYAGDDGTRRRQEDTLAITSAVEAGL